MKNPSKRLLCLILTFALLLAGSALAAAEQPVTIRFAWWGGDARHQATLEALEIFQKKHPNIKVDAEYQGYDGYHDKIFTQLASGTAPDLFQYNPQNLPDIINEGMLEPLGPYAESGALDLTNVPAASLSSTTIDGVTYAIPMSIQTFCIIYNKTLFDQAGVAYPADDWTWEDYDRIVLELKEKLPEGVYPSDDMRVMDITTLSMVHQAGGAYLTLDGQLNFKDYIGAPLQKFQDYMKAGLVPPHDELVALTRDRFLMEGKMAMAPQFNAMAAGLQAGATQGNVFALTTLPGSNTGDFLGNFAKGELGFCVNANSANKDAAVELLNAFVNDEDMGAVLRMVRGLPPSQKMQEMLAKDMTDLEKDVIKVQSLVANSKDTPEPLYMKGWDQVQAIIAEETDQYAFEKKDLQAAIDAMQVRCEEAMRDAAE